MAIKVISTTDGKFIGKVFPVNSIEEIPNTFEVIDGTLFRIEKRMSLGGNKWRLSNSNYVVDVEVL